MNNCKDCNCNCHCNVKGHSDLYGVCPCENCKCKEKEVIVDDKNECLSCQQKGETMAKKKKKKGKKKNKKNKKKKRQLNDGYHRFNSSVVFYNLCYL